MSILFYIVIFAFTSLNHPLILGMEESSMENKEEKTIHLLDCTGEIFQLYNNTASLIFPSYYTAREEWTDTQQIDLSQSDIDEENKKLLTHDNIRLLEQIALLPTIAGLDEMQLTPEKVLQLCTITNYFNTDASITKKLGYCLRKHYAFHNLPEFLLSPLYTYSIEDLLQDEFFKGLIEQETTIVDTDEEDIEKEGNGSARKLLTLTQQQFIGEEVKSPFIYHYNLDLTNYNIGSLEGINQLLTKINSILNTRHPYFDTCIDTVSLTNNSLALSNVTEHSNNDLLNAVEYLELDENPTGLIGNKFYPNFFYYTRDLEKIHGNNNKRSLMPVKTSSSTHSLAHHPTLSSKLNSKDYYYLRSRKHKRHTLLRTLITSGVLTFGWKLLTDKITTFAPSFSSSNYFMPASAIGIGSLALLYTMKIESYNPFFNKPVDHLNLPNKGVLHSLKDFGQDLFYMTGEIITTPLKMLYNRN